MRGLAMADVGDETWARFSDGRTGQVVSNSVVNGVQSYWIKFADDTQVLAAASEVMLIVRPRTQNPILFTLDDVARRLNISTAKVRELVLTRQLSASRKDGQLLFTQDDVHTFLLAAFAALDDDDDDWSDDADDHDASDQ